MSKLCPQWKAGKLEICLCKLSEEYKQHLHMHSIKESHLKRLVLGEIQAITKSAREYPEQFTNFIGRRVNATRNKTIAESAKQLTKYEKRMAELITIFKKLYEDHMLGTIDDGQLRQRASGY